jgi:hypothetical protein
MMIPIKNPAGAAGFRDRFELLMSSFVAAAAIGNGGER